MSSTTDTERLSSALAWIQPGRPELATFTPGAFQFVRGRIERIDFCLRQIMPAGDIPCVDKRIDKDGTSLVPCAHLVERIATS